MALNAPCRHACGDGADEWGSPATGRAALAPRSRFDGNSRTVNTRRLPGVQWGCRQRGRLPAEEQGASDQQAWGCAQVLPTTQPRPPCADVLQGRAHETARTSRRRGGTDGPSISPPAGRRAWFGGPLPTLHAARGRSRGAARTHPASSGAHVARASDVRTRAPGPCRHNVSLDVPGAPLRGCVGLSRCHAGSRCPSGPPAPLGHNSAPEQEPRDVAPWGHPRTVRGKGSGGDQ